MVQQFNTPQKTRQAVILFLKGSATPIVMYYENPQAVYAELKQLMKSPTPVLVEKSQWGRLRNFVCFNPDSRYCFTGRTVCIMTRLF